MFKISKKKEETKSGCCGGISAPEAMEHAEQANTAVGIKVLGGGCAKCHELEANTKAALSELGMKEDVELITDFAVIAAYGVMSTPALVIDNKVVSCGKVLKTSEVAAILKEKRG